MHYLLDLTWPHFLLLEPTWFQKGMAPRWRGWIIGQNTANRVGASCWRCYSEESLADVCNNIVPKQSICLLAVLLYQGNTCHSVHCHFTKIVHTSCWGCYCTRGIPGPVCAFYQGQDVMFAVLLYQESPWLIRRNCDIMFVVLRGARRIYN